MELDIEEKISLADSILYTIYVANKRGKYLISENINDILYFCLPDNCRHMFINNGYKGPTNPNIYMCIEALAKKQCITYSLHPDTFSSGYLLDNLIRKYIEDQYQIKISLESDIVTNYFNYMNEKFQCKLSHNKDSNNPIINLFRKENILLNHYHLLNLLCKIKSFVVANRHDIDASFIKERSIHLRWDDLHNMPEEKIDELKSIYLKIMESINE